MVRFHPELPQDPRTLLSTGTGKDIKAVSGGSYGHLGLTFGLHTEMNISPLGLDTLQLQFSIDGLPLFRPSSCQVWPILCLNQNFWSSAKPFVVSLFLGSVKPSDPEEYLSDFITELSNLLWI